MANIFEYLKWRGDLSFENTPFCPVDALVFGRISYLPFDGVVSSRFSDEPMKLGVAARQVSHLIEQGEYRELLQKADDEKLLHEIIENKRFSELLVAGYVNKYDENLEEQFSAMTILMPDKTMMVLYRGTDDTLIGWKEDFNMLYEETIPGWIDSVDYLETAAKFRTKGSIRVCGHSKGGNFAVYASAFCQESVQSRITEVINLDGPGFREVTINEPGFQRIIGKIHTYIPQSSFFGLLLEHAEDFNIVKSSNAGPFQHDIYSWEVTRDAFEDMGALTNSSQLIDAKLKEWVSELSWEKREILVNGLFRVVGKTDARTLKDLKGGKNTIVILRAFSQLDTETKTVLDEAVKIFRKTMKGTLIQIESRDKEKEEK